MKFTKKNFFVFSKKITDNKTNVGITTDTDSEIDVKLSDTSKKLGIRYNNCTIVKMLY